MHSTQLVLSILCDMCPHYSHAINMIPIPVQHFCMTQPPPHHHSDMENLNLLFYNLLILQLTAYTKHFTFLDLNQLHGSL